MQKEGPPALKIKAPCQPTNQLVCGLFEWNEYRNSNYWTIVVAKIYSGL